MITTVFFPLFSSFLRDVLQPLVTGFNMSISSFGLPVFPIATRWNHRRNRLILIRRIGQAMVDRPSIIGSISCTRGDVALDLCQQALDLRRASPSEAIVSVWATISLV